MESDSFQWHPVPGEEAMGKNWNARGSVWKHVFTVHGDGAWAQVAHKESPSLKIFKTHLDMVLGNLL